MEGRRHNSNSQSQSLSQSQQRRNGLSRASASSSSSNSRSNQTKIKRSFSCDSGHNNAPNVGNNFSHVLHNQQEPEPVIGTCPFMCPEEERLQRQRLRDLAVFERLNGDPCKSSTSLAVKKFCRTMSAKHVQASDVRPLPVLEQTLNHLLNLLDSKEHEHPFEVIHDFVFDRTRSIRQDLSMQHLVNDTVIHICEKIVKFHVISHNKLRSSCSGPSTSSLHYLNLEQLKKALASLYTLYEANRSSYSSDENEAEFRSFYVLLHLDSSAQPMGESLSLWFRHVPPPIIKSKEMSFARRVLRCFRMGNYKQFFCSAAEASYLQYCIIEPYIHEVRLLALCCINNGGYKLNPYPLLHLSKLLMMEESDVELFCYACGLQTCTDNVGTKLLPTKQTTFCCAKDSLQKYSFLGWEKLKSDYLSTGKRLGK